MTKYMPYSTICPANGANIEVVYDFRIAGRNMYISVRDNDATTDNTNDNADHRLFTVKCDNKTSIALETSEAAKSFTTGGDDSYLTLWFHVEASINMSTKKQTIRIYKYKANNNYKNETPVIEAVDVGFRDTNATGVAGFDVYSPTNGANVYFDNFYIYDETYTEPMSITSSDATVTPAAVRTNAEGKPLADQEISIVPKAKAGYKVTGVKVNGEDADNESGYTYTTSGDETELTVTVEYARDNANDIAISGPTMIKIPTAETNEVTYTATVTNEAGDTLDTTTDKVTWSKELIAESGAANIDNVEVDAESGKVTVSTGQVTGAFNLVATVKKDVTADDGDTNKVTKKYKITLTSNDVYSVEAAPTEHGKVQFKIGGEDVTAFDSAANLTITTVPDAHYHVASITWQSDASDDLEATTLTTESANNYTLAGSAVSAKTNPTKVTVTVVFELDKFTLTNNKHTAQNGNQLKIKIGDAPDENTDETIQVPYGSKVTVVPTVSTENGTYGFGYKMTALTYNGTDILAAKTFTMPDQAVTVDATFEDWDGTYYSEDFNDFTGKQSLVDAGWSIHGDVNGEDATIIKTKTDGDTTKYAYFTNKSTSGNRSATINVNDSVIDSGSVILEADLNFKAGGDRITFFKTGAFTLGISKEDKLYVNIDTANGDTLDKVSDIVSSTAQKEKWVHLKATMDYTTKKVKIEIKDAESTDILTQTVNMPANNNGLQVLDFSLGRSSGAIGVDNISVKKTTESVTA